MVKHPHTDEYRSNSEGFLSELNKLALQIEQELLTTPGVDEINQHPEIRSHPLTINQSKWRQLATKIKLRAPLFSCLKTVRVELRRRGSPVMLFTSLLLLAYGAISSLSDGHHRAQLTPDVLRSGYSVTNAAQDLREHAVLLSALSNNQSKGALPEIEPRSETSETRPSRGQDTPTENLEHYVTQALGQDAIPTARLLELNDILPLLGINDRQPPLLTPWCEK